MKNKYIILISAIFLTISTGNCADFYPEMQLDPFHSEFNPEYINKETTATGEFALKTFFKQKIQQHKEKKIKNKEQKKLEKEQKKLEKEKTFVTKPKKHLTKAQLERELNKEEREKEKELEKQREKQENRSLTEKIFNTPKTNEQSEYIPPENPNINLTADFTEYYPSTYEIHAIGNAKVVFQSQNTTLEADKIIFDYDKNIVTAKDNVVLTSKDSVTEGDFIKLDLSKPTGWIETPVTKTEDIKIKAKEAVIYSDSITEYDGSAKILKNAVFSFGGRSFSAYVDNSGLIRENTDLLNDKNTKLYKIKANTIIIDSKDDHEVVTIKNAGVYLKNHKLGTIPTLKMVTDKAHTNIETNIPEIGSQSMMGFHAGPAVVLNVPGGSTLKLAPVLTYGNDKFGIGGIARFRSENNITQIAYGTSKKTLIIDGHHKIANGLSLNYSRYANQSEWFLGYRMPKYSVNLNYNRSDYIKDLKLTFSQSYSAGLFVDDNDDYDWSNNHTRLRWMTQTYKPLYDYINTEGNIELKLGLVMQTSASVYSQGNALGLFRIGPSLSTRVGRWNQSIMYFQTASAGESPFEFDRYRYGKSNLVIMEGLQVCKYVTLGYLASISMNNQYRNDYHHDDLFQENRFVVSVGPEYVKLILGYDALRHNLMMTLNMLVDTKNLDIDFKHAIVKNPAKVGKEKSKQKKVKRKSYKKYVKDIKKQSN